MFDECLIGTDIVTNCDYDIGIGFVRVDFLQQKGNASYSLRNFTGNFAAYLDWAG
jgi:hypothetical protein